MSGAANAARDGECADAGEDPEIVAALQAADYREVTAIAARRYGTALGRLCMAMIGTQAVAEELAQETLLTAHNSLGNWRRDSTLRAWLFGIARNKCLKHVETQRRQSSKLFLLKTEAGDAADDLLHRRRLAMRAREALDQVRPSEREALLLRYTGELSFREVAAAAGVEEPTARQRVSRALARLREVLKVVE